MIAQREGEGNFNNRGSYNGRLAPQNTTTEQTAGLPLTQPTQAIPQGENNGENLQTQTAKRGENRENLDVNAEPKQAFQNEGNENATHPQGNEVTPTLAPSSRGISDIAQNTPKTDSDANALTADKVDGKALEKATAATADTVSARSEISEAKAKENAVLDNDSTVSIAKKIADERAQAVENGKETKEVAKRKLDDVEKKVKSRLDERLAKGEISKSTHDKFVNRAKEIKEEALSRIEQKEEIAKEATTEAKPQEKKTDEAKEIEKKDLDNTGEATKRTPKREPQGKSKIDTEQDEKKGLPMTGKPFVMDYYHNTEKAPKMADDAMAQSIEPTGEYMGNDTAKGIIRLPGYEYGMIHFDNPLVIEYETTGHGGWKTKLSQKYNGETGAALSRAIKKDGYDGIITVDSKAGEIVEVVNLSGKKENTEADTKTKETATKPKTEDKKAEKTETKETPKKEEKKISKEDQEKDAHAKKTLSKEAYEKVYLPIVEVLENAKGKVAEAARDTALVMSKIAESLHKRHGMKYEDAPRVLLGNSVDEGDVYYSPAYDVSKSIKTLSAFRTMYMEREEDGQPINKIRVEINGVKFPEERIRHITSEHHFEDWQLDDLAENIETIHSLYKSEWQDGKYTGQYRGVSVVGIIKGKKCNYFVSLTVRDNGEIYFNTAAPYVKEESIRKEIEERYRAGVLSPIGAASPGRDGSSISIKSLPEALGIVKKEVFNQPAWHGSPYTFEKFDLGKIGNGEGAQAHGWGLYFAEDRDIANLYKFQLGLRNGKAIIFNGETYQGRRNRYYGANGEVEIGTPLWHALSYIDLAGAVETAVKNAERHLVSCQIGLKDQIEAKQKGEPYSQVLIDSYKRGIQNEKETIALLENSTAHIERTARLYEVSVPESDVMLDEQKAYSKQPEKVKENLSRAIKELNKELKEKGLSLIRPGNASGRNLYNALSDALGGDKAASLFLNEHGIKGITYEGRADGRCFVVFDDKAVSIIETYNQEINDEIAGSYSVFENLIKIYETGNASTAVHESAHWYLTTLENLVRTEAEKCGITGTLDEMLSALAEDGTVPKGLVKELQTIREWAEFSEEHVKEYEGTALEKEFAKLAEAIRNGDKEAAERFIQERFARGFERYLMSGKAPSKELEGAFKRFRKWMLDIYKTITNLGKKASPKEIQDIFDRMLAMENGETKPKKEYPTGKKTTLITDRGDEFAVTYKLMPVEDVVTSNDANFGENPNFPTELQPRDRDREGLKAQVRSIAEKINPRELTETIFPNQGAPVINEDNVAESGNGRTMGIALAYTDGGELYQKNADKYKAYLAEHAEDFGFTKEQVEAIDHPILVRQRTHESDHLQMDIITSTRGGARLSAGQQARIDAKKISEDTLSLYRYDGSGDLTTAKNRDFIAAFIDEVVDPNDRDVMQDGEGNLSADGLRRIKLALCAKAFENTKMIDEFSENTDPEAKNFVEAYKIVAPRIAAIKNIVESGGVDESYNLPKLLDESLKFYLDAKKEGVPVRDKLNQGAGLFKEGKSQFEIPGSREFVDFLAGHARQKKVVIDAMTDMAEAVTDIANRNKHDTLIEGGSEKTLYDIVRMALGKNESNFTISEDGKTLTAKPDKWEAASKQKRENVATIAKGKGAEKVDTEKGVFTFPDEITREETSNIMDAEMDVKYSKEGDIGEKLRNEAKMIPENELTEREKGIVAFANKMGVQVQFFDGNKNLHGWQQGDVVFLNRNSAKDLNFVFWHEVFHWLARNNPELYEKIKKAVLQNDDIAAQIEAYMEETGRTDLTVEEAIEEMLADAMSEASKRGSFFETLGVTHPTLVQKIIKWMKNIYNDFVAQYRRTKGFRAEAGLTNTQIKRMSVALDGMALKLKDGQGNRLFRADSKGNLVSVGVKDVAYANGVKYLVTNRKIKGEYRIPVVDVTNAERVNLRDKAETDALYERVGNQILHFFGGTGIVKKYDKKSAPDKNKKMWNHLIHGSGSHFRKANPTMEKVFAMLPEVLHGCVYIDKHVDSIHGTKTNYVEAFVPIRDGNKLSVYHFTARDRGTLDMDEVGLATFYNVKEDKSTVPQFGRNRADLPSEMSIAEILEGVKDRDGNLYVISEPHVILSQ